MNGVSGLVRVAVPGVGIVPLRSCAPVEAASKGQGAHSAPKANDKDDLNRDDIRAAEV